MLDSAVGGRLQPQVQSRGEGDSSGGIPLLGAKFWMESGYRHCTFNGWLGPRQARSCLAMPRKEMQQETKATQP